MCQPHRQLPRPQTRVWLSKVPKSQGSLWHTTLAWSAPIFSAGQAKSYLETGRGQLLDRLEALVGQPHHGEAPSQWLADAVVINLARQLRDTEALFWMVRDRLPALAQRLKVPLSQVTLDCSLVRLEITATSAIDGQVLPVVCCARQPHGRLSPHARAWVHACNWYGPGGSATRWPSACFRPVEGVGFLQPEGPPEDHALFARSRVEVLAGPLPEAFVAMVLPMPHYLEGYRQWCSIQRAGELDVVWPMLSEDESGAPARL